MAEDERLTKAERREQARAERRRKEAEEAARAKRRRIISIIVGLLITAFVAWVLWLAFAGGTDTIDDLKVINPQEAAEARTDAGCVPMDLDPAAPATHFEPAEAPPADALYTLRPTANGPHFNRTASPGVFRNPIDERAVTHSMEHGAIVVWYDPAQVDGDTVGQIRDWAEVLNGSGFSQQAGAGIYVSPFAGTFTSGKPIALRGWAAAIDCDEWQELVGDAFVVDHYGTNGFGPEAGSFARYPSDTMVFAPGAEETEVPNGAPSGDAPDGSGTDEDQGDDTTDGASPADDPTEDTTDEESPAGDATGEASPTGDASPDAS